MRIGLGVLYRTQILCCAGQVTEISISPHDFVLNLKRIVVVVTECQSRICSGMNIVAIPGHSEIKQHG